MKTEPILYLPLNEIDNGQTRDHMGQRFPVRGALEIVPDPTFGQVFDFPGTATDYVIVHPARFFPSDAVTLTCWIKTRDTKKEDATILSYNLDSDNHFTLLNFKKISLFLDNQRIASKTRVNDGRWCHLAVTWQNDSGLLLMYKDGREIFRKNAKKGVA